MNKHSVNKSRFLLKSNNLRIVLNHHETGLNYMRLSTFLIHGCLAQF